MLNPSTLPSDVRRAVEDTMNLVLLQCWLLRRVVQLLAKD